jgi:ribokinase
MSTKTKRSAAADVVVVGSFNQDMVWQTPRFPTPGETRLGRFHSGPGGKGFNQAVAAARQGAKTCFIAAIGRDALGERAQALAMDEGIDGRWQQVAAEATGTAAIWLDGDGQNQIVVAPGANALLAPAHVLAQAGTIRAARVLLTQHEVHPVATLRALEVAAEAGVLRIHNPAPAQAHPANRQSLQLADILTPNESEFIALLGEQAEGLAAAALAGIDDASLHALCRRLPVPTVVLTLGGAGVFVSHAEPARRNDAAAYYRIAAEAVQVLDTTGAGDCFSGALAAACARDGGQAFVEHVRHANRSAALAVESPGAAPAMPRRDEVLRRFPA